MEEALQLNLTTVVEPEISKKRKEDPEAEKEQDVVAPAKKKKKLPNKDSQKANTDSSSGPKEGEDFISSLFNNNPEIPKLELASGEGNKKEAVFTEKPLG